MTRGFSAFIGLYARIIISASPYRGGIYMDKNLIDEILRDIGLETYRR